MGKKAGRKRIALIGLDIFGSILARELSRYKFEVLAIDMDEDKINAVKDFVTIAVVADATDEKVMSSLGIGDCDVVIVTMASNLEVNALVSLLCLQLGAKKVIAKALTLPQLTILEKIGVHEVLIPEYEAGLKLASKLANKHAVDMFSPFEDYNIVELETPEIWIDKSIADIDMKNNYNVSLLFLKRGDEYDHYIKWETKLQKDDILAIGGSPHYIDTLIEKLAKQNVE